MIAVLLLLLLGQDGGEPGGTGIPMASIGRSVPPVVRMSGAVALSVALSACCPPPYKPEAKHPTWAEIEALAAAVPLSTKSPVVARFDLRLMPPIILAGSATWVRCFVPDGLGSGRIRFGIEGLAMSGPMPLDRVEHRRLVERIACGEWIAVCEVWVASGHHRLERPLLSKGSCNDGL